MWVGALVIATVVGLLTKWVMDRRRRQQTFCRLGLPGPQPNLFNGNMKDLDALHAQKKSPFMELAKKYGNTFGYYEGDIPIIVTSDTDVIKGVLIKNFSGFHSRKFNLFMSGDDSVLRAEGKQWKRLRSIISPTFSASRMKEMSPLINTCVSSLLVKFDKRAREDKPFDIVKDFQGLTMSAIAVCGFGLELDAISNPDNVFLKKCEGIFNFGTTAPWYTLKIILPMMHIFPGIFKILKWFSKENFSLPRKWFHETAAKIIEERKTQKEKRCDFIQLMLEAEDQDIPSKDEHLEIAVDNDTTDPPATSEATSSAMSQAKTATSLVRGKGMTLSEMQAQCTVFLLAGYETTSTALSFAAYELACHPDIQCLLQEEIDELLPGDELPDYLSVQKMPYMDRFFNEVLRLHTIAEIVETRTCFEDVTVGKLYIPKGVVVQVNVQAVHMDPEHWGPEDTVEFVPDRFLPERKAARHSMAWLPFGAGPRNCVGMRFALMEAKITLTRMLRAYSIVKTDELQVPLPASTRGLFRPVGGVFIKLERRSQTITE